VLNVNDVDGDTVYSCDGDCNDGDPSVSTGDFDGDGYTTCSNPADCDDGNSTLNWDDADGDGWTSCAGDCDDSLSIVYPGNGVQCDAIGDTDCDGIEDPLEVDSDTDGASECEGDCDDSNPLLNIQDSDGDGWSTCTGDCDDTEDTVFPTAPALCDGILDNDCNNVIDASEADQDQDGDTLCDGDCNDFDASLDVSDADGDGATSCDGDCDDNDPLLSPSIDADGDGWDTCGGFGYPADCDDTEPESNWDDIDGDGSSSCSVPADCDDEDFVANQQDEDEDGETSCDGDCNDGNDLMNSGGVEVRDSLDNDCDGTADEGLISAGNLAIIEMMVGAAPATTDGYGEYVEIYNTTATAIDLRGWTVEVAAGSNPANVFEFSSDEDPMTAMLVNPGARIVLARSTNELGYGSNIADYFWSAAAFSDTGGTIVLKFGSTTVDSVTWTGSGCSSNCSLGSTNSVYAGPSYWRAGYAMSLKSSSVSSSPATANDSMNNWCEDRTALGAIDHGSPGTAPGTLGPCGP
jgi:hypothetical protein